MTVSASMVKELRERTGAGMMECKKALVESTGDINTAIELLRKSGQAKADRKSGRVAADGRVIIVTDDLKGAMAEINSETDFVAKDDNFVAFSKAVANCILASDSVHIDTLAFEILADGRTVEAARTELVTKVGENISVRRFCVLEGAERLGTYTHGGRIGVMVSLKGGDDDLARDVAMHIAATNPVCIDETDVPVDVLERERRIFSEQAGQSGKPPEIIEKMVTGRLSKFLREITLAGQPFVKDPDITVGRLLADAGAEVTKFDRYEVGAGIDKRQDNFVEEVMSQVKSV